MSCLNNVPPLVLPITPNSILGNGSVFGLAATVGSPQEPVSFSLDLSDNNTNIATILECSSGAEYPPCVVLMGGLYYPPQSTTAQRFSSDTAGWNGSINSASAVGNFSDGSYYNWYEDNVSINGYELSQFPFYSELPINREVMLVPTQVGLGFNSTFLQALFTAGYAPSTRYGLWTGVRGWQQLNGGHLVDSATQGQLIVGGYDEGKFTGEPVIFQSSSVFQPSAVYNTQLVDIMLGSTSLFPNINASIYQAALDASLGFMQLPTPAYQNFLSLTGGESVSLDFGNTSSVPFTAEVPRYNNSYSINSSLTIILSDGNGDNYTTTIPASWLMGDPNIYYSQPGYGFATVSPTNSTLFRLGLPFMAFNYLISVLDGYDYYMAPIAVNSSLASDVRGFCPYTPSTSNSSDTASSHRTSVAAIVGGVLGGIFALLLAGVLWLFLQRYRRRKAERLLHQAELAATTTSSENSTTAVDDSEDRQEKGNELWTSNHSIELAGSAFRPEELGGKWILEALGNTRLPTEMRGSSHRPKELEALDAKDRKEETPPARVIEGGPFEMQ